MGSYFTAHWTMGKKCRLGKNKSLLIAYTIKPMFSWDLKKKPKTLIINDNSQPTAKQ